MKDKPIIYVYIASRYTNGDVAQNIRTQIDTAERLINTGFVPFTPTLMHFHHFVHPHAYEDWMEQCLSWVERCDALLRLPGSSPGADREAQHAMQKGIPVFYSLEELIVQSDTEPF